jgi:hypothetical protein
MESYVIVAVLAAFVSSAFAIWSLVRDRNLRHRQLQQDDSRKATIKEDNYQLTIDVDQLTKEQLQNIIAVLERIEEQQEQIEEERESIELSLVEAREAEPEEEKSDEQVSVDRLAEQYNTVRMSMPSGLKRTREMTAIVSKMISVLQGVKDFDVSSYLHGKDRGRRLAGFAFLYANPDPRRTSELVDLLLVEDKPFGQYWALRALRKQLDTDPSALDRDTRSRLESFLRELTPGSDRAIELQRVLEAAP